MLIVSKKNERNTSRQNIKALTESRQAKSIALNQSKLRASGMSSRSRKLVMAKPPRDDSDDLPCLKTGCKNFNLPRIKAIAYY
ncbi:hypothetical protein [Nostoc flagelliforme]|uniref:hypothetical protein n=1 Tax=Nostoc flagelliforme TaxID=1306274 RepID=UPI000C2CF34E